MGSKKRIGALGRSVTILAAIVIPIGGSIARQRDRSTCFFNLKSIGMALENYRQDHDGFPPDITETGGETPGLGLYTLYWLTAGSGVPERYPLLTITFAVWLGLANHASR